MTSVAPLRRQHCGLGLMWCNKCKCNEGGQLDPDFAPCPRVSAECCSKQRPTGHWALREYGVHNEIGRRTAFAAPRFATSSWRDRPPPPLRLWQHALFIVCRFLLQRSPGRSAGGRAGLLGFQLPVAPWLAAAAGALPP
jgi:hypothetical protein